MITPKTVGELRAVLEDIPDSRPIYVMFEDSEQDRVFVFPSTDARKDIVQVEVAGKHKEIKNTKPVAALVILCKVR